MSDVVENATSRYPPGELGMPEFTTPRLENIAISHRGRLDFLAIFCGRLRSYRACGDAGWDLFENFVLDCDCRELRRGASLVALEPQVFDLLAYLIENRELVRGKRRSSGGDLGWPRCFGINLEQPCCIGAGSHLGTVVKSSAS